MKSLLIAAAAFAALGGAASADRPGRIAPPTLVEVHGEAACALRVQGGAVDAFGAPWNADSWSLSVRAPGLTVDQGGGFVGDERRMERLSRIYAIDQDKPLNRWSRGTDIIKRPLRAELVLHDETGRVVCEDQLHLRPGRR
ncbi:MAG: hypothetical protein RKE49_14350 [Oceanicaulis sp.]